MGEQGRLGILGGTFDPVHVGHLVAAVNARYELDLDRVLLVVANEPWQKVGSRPVTPAADRLALVQAAVEGVEGLEASAIEIERGGLSYTADTVAELQHRWPERRAQPDRRCRRRCRTRVLGTGRGGPLRGGSRRGEPARNGDQHSRPARGMGRPDGRGAGARDLEHGAARSGGVGTSLRLPRSDARHPCDPRTRPVPCGEMSRRARGSH